MLTISKLAPGGQNYYLDSVASGAEEYYTTTREAPGRWMGKASSRLGLSGRVTAHDLGAVLSGRAPDGTQLVGKQGRDRMPGYDVVISPPKSVSLLWALGSLDVSRQVREAHDAAVDVAIGVLEEMASRGRRGRGGMEVVHGDGFVAAGFRHRTSRERDPQLHTHVLVTNLVHALSDSRWSALDGRAVYGWGRAVGFIYEAQLRVELTRRLGVAWGPTKQGIGDIAGIPKRVLDCFSKRRKQIEAHMAAAGTTGAKAAQAATYATRKPKDTTTSMDELIDDWRATALAVGFDDEKLDALLGRDFRHEPVEPGSPEARVMFAQLALASGLTERQPTFNRRDVITHICDRLPAGADADNVLALADAFLQSREVVPLVCGDTDQIRRKDGKSAPIPTDPSRYTTRDMLQVEKDLLQLVTSRRVSGAGVAHAPAVEGAIADRETLTDEQVEMIRRVCQSGAGVDVIVGSAGAGKTFGLAAAHDAWTSSGYKVIGACLAARAARELEDGSGIPSSTIHRLLAELARPESGGLGPHHVVVVDEAAMVGTRKLLDLVRHAHHAKAKVVLIGDPCQLPAIEAGGAFAALARTGDSAALMSNRRQVEAWERQALSDLRSGRAEEALAAYTGHDRIRHDEDPVALRDQIVDHWWTATDDGSRTVMVALQNHHVEALNLCARQRMRDAGRLGERERLLGGHCYAVGDTVVAHRNDARIGIVNGDRGKVTAIDEPSGRLDVELDGGRTVSVPFSYAEAGKLTYGYATTIHKTQGGTVDAAFVLVHPSMTNEQLYSAVSRGRRSNVMYVSPDDPRGEVSHVPEAEREPEALLLTVMRRSSAESMAIDAGGLSL